MYRINTYSSRIIFQYFQGLLVFVVTTGILFLLRDRLDTPLIALLFLLPVGLNTALWGLGPGILTALLAFLGFNYLFIRPYYTLAVHQSSDLIVLVVFLIVAVVISQLVGRAQAGLAAANAREREATKLYELSIALAGVQDDLEIIRILADEIAQTFKTERVEMTVESHIQGQKIEFSLPAGKSSPLRRPEWGIPLQTARGPLGEVRLWCANVKLHPAEEQLLHAFVNQGAMALERARLAQTETRAKVLEESDHLKSALLSSVSHELRSPLATIKASITSLRSDNVRWESSAREDLLANVDDETDHLNRLVGNLLDMSRIESGALKPQRQWNLLSEIIGSVISRMRKVTEQHRLDVNLPDDLPLVPVDYVQMEQVFDNLISNSLKYAPPNTTIHILAGKQTTDTLLVTVSNQGPHVPQEHLDRIFDKFYRVTDADRVTGTGLGLSICKGIISAHGGSIWAENLPDGFAFNFTIPLTLDGTPPPTLPVDSETI